MRANLCGPFFKSILGEIYFTIYNLVTTAGAVYIADKSLDEIAEELDPHAFFKISRSCIVSLGAIISITKLVGGRLQISARPKPSFDMVVSRSRSDDFLTWLER